VCVYVCWQDEVKKLLKEVENLKEALVRACVALAVYVLELHACCAVRGVIGSCADDMCVCCAQASKTQFANEATEEVRLLKEELEELREDAQVRGCRATPCHRGGQPHGPAACLRYCCNWEACGLSCVGSYCVIDLTRCHDVTVLGGCGGDARPWRRRRSGRRSWSRRAG
jgi:hypothetical protein